MIRIYQPQLHFGSDRDQGRHRYFSEEQITELTEGAIREIIVRSIARRANASYYADVTSIEDVNARTREMRIRSLRQRADDTSKTEWIRLLEQDNEDHREKIRQLTAKLEAAIENGELLETQLHNSEKEISRLNFLVQDLSSKATAANKAAEDMASRFRSFYSLAKLPDSVRDVAERIQMFYPNALVFTDRGLRSTEDRHSSVVSEAWECLWAMATVLHPLIFTDSGKGMDIEGEFKRRTGVDLAMSESKHTKKDKKFMDLRKDSYQNRNIDISPHLKVGNKEPKLLRIHFCIDHEHKMFVIGHCGGHLESFSSRKI